MAVRKHAVAFQLAYVSCAPFQECANSSSNYPDVERRVGGVVDSGARLGVGSVCFRLGVLQTSKYFTGTTDVFFFDGTPGPWLGFMATLSESRFRTINTRGTNYRRDVRGFT